MTETTSYHPFDTLEALAAHAAAKTEKGQRHLNFFLAAELPASAIRDQPIADMTETAQKWREPEVPDSLIINHGKYIGKGIEHIIKELHDKPSSNRALYSLISQKHIIGSEDNPIPSFMIFQCAIESDILYCTVYFRALEVANFFRINLEEIRLNLCDILKGLSAAKVRLSVLAFSAYSKPDQVPLEKCELDLMSSLKLMSLYNKNPERISELLDQKAKESTIIDISGLKAIKESLAPEHKDMRPSHLKDVPLIVGAVDKAITFAEELRSLRAC